MAKKKSILPAETAVKSQSEKTSSATDEQIIDHKLVDLGEAEIAVIDIVVSPLNPRKHFPEDELRLLGESLQVMQMQNLTVRPIRGLKSLATAGDDSYELIGGERRYRAAKLVGLRTLRCRIIDCDDVTAIDLRGIENYRRAQLNAVEEAIWFQQMLDTGRYNQTTLADYLGITPGQVSNRLRLLTLPDEWKDKIANGELPPTHARALASWSSRPDVLVKVAELVQKEGRVFNDVPTTAIDTYIRNAVVGLTREMTPNLWDSPKFQVTDAIREQLDVVEIKNWRGDPQYRAFQTVLWDELQAEAEANADDDDEVDENADDPNYLADGVDELPGDEFETYSRLHDYGLEIHFKRFFCNAIAAKVRPDANAVRLLLSIACDFDGSDVVHSVLENFAGHKGDHIPGMEYEKSAQIYDLTTKMNSKNAFLMASDAVVAILSKKEADGSEDGCHDLSLAFAIQLTKKDFPCEPLKEWRADIALLDKCSTVELRELFTEQMADPKKLAKWDRLRLQKELVEHWPPGYLPELLVPVALRQALKADANNDGDDEEGDGDE